MQSFPDIAEAFDQVALRAKPGWFSTESQIVRDSVNRRDPEGLCCLRTFRQRP